MATAVMREASTRASHDHQEEEEDEQQQQQQQKVAAADAAWRAYRARVAAADAAASPTAPPSVVIISEAEARAVAAVGGAALAADQELAEAERELRGWHVPAFWARLSAVEASLSTRAAAARQQWQRQRQQQQPTAEEKEQQRQQAPRLLEEDEESMLCGALEDLAGAVLSQRACVAALAQRLLVATAAEAWRGGGGGGGGSAAASEEDEEDDADYSEDSDDSDSGDGPSRRRRRRRCLPPGLAAQVAAVAALSPRHAAMCGALLAAGAPVSLASLLRRYYTAKVRELARAMSEFEEEEDEEDGEEEEDGEDEGEDADADAAPRICRPGRAAARALAALGPRWPEGPRRCARALGCLAGDGGIGHNNNSNSSRTTTTTATSSTVRALHEEACAAAARLHVAEAVAARASGSFEARALPGARRMALRGAPFELLRLVLLAEAEGAALASAAVTARAAARDADCADADAAATEEQQQHDPPSPALPCLAASSVAPRLRDWRLRLSYLALETLGALRTREFFDAVVDWPSSRPAVLDAASCLAHTSLAPAFAGAVRAQLRSRLLHAGALTPDVLHTYVAAIRALAEVDPTGGLARGVVAPVRAHLRRRPDAVRCVVALLTGDGGGGAGGGGGGGGAAGPEGEGPTPLLLEELMRQEQQEEEEEEHGERGARGRRGDRGGGGAPAGGDAVLTRQEAREAWPTTEADGDQLALQLLMQQQEEEDDEEEEEQGGAAAGQRRRAAAAAAAAGRSGSGAAPPLAAAPPRRPPRVDVVPMLIAIYGSPALFLAEYRAMLGARLLAPPASRPAELGPSSTSRGGGGPPQQQQTQPPPPPPRPFAPSSSFAPPAAPVPQMAGGSVYDATRELRTLELLKMRFGEGALRSAEVMLRDVADSRRVNLGVHAIAGEALMAAEGARRARARAAAAEGGGGRGSGGGGGEAGGEEGPEDDGLAGEGEGEGEGGAAGAPPPPSFAPLADDDDGGDDDDPAAASAAAAAAAAAAASPPFLPKLDATIASRLYWPLLPGGAQQQQRPLALPPAVKAAMRAYGRRFSHLKAPRRLKWRPALGLVELEVRPSGPGSAPITFRVTPPHAALLLALDESGAPDAGDGRAPLPPGPVPASALAERLGVPAAVVRQKALFWVNAGVLSERRVDGDVVYERVRGGGGGGAGGGGGGAAGGASGGAPAAAAAAAAAASLSPYEATDLTWADPGAGGAGGGGAAGRGGGAEARLRAEVGPFEGYVIGLLTNMGGGQGLSLDRLHGLLRVFCVGEPKYEGRVTQEQLAAYLALMAAKGAVVAERGGTYRRPGAGQQGGAS